MISPGHERGFGFLRNVAIDQHLLARKRENDVFSLAVIAAHPELLGIGIDQSTAIVVKGDQFVVLRPRIGTFARAAEPGIRRSFLLPRQFPVALEEIAKSISFAGTRYHLARLAISVFTARAPNNIQIAIRIFPSSATVATSAIAA